MEIGKNQMQYHKQETKSELIYTQTKKIRPIFMILYLLIQLRCQKIYQNVYQTSGTQKLVIN